MVTVITPTGGRPEAFSLCHRFMERQSFQGEVQWIVVDDGAPRTTDSLPSRHEVLYLFPTPPWSPRQNTLSRNLLKALPHVKYDKVLIIEDDNWYAPTYIETMSQRLEDGDLVGENSIRYYHVPSHQWRTMGIASRASLGQTGFRAKVLPELCRVCGEGLTFIDVRLWETSGRKVLSPDSGICIGMKGLPGRPGIGVGHRPECGGDWAADPDSQTLRSWIGEDANLFWW